MPIKFTAAAVAAAAAVLGLTATATAQSVGDKDADDLNHRIDLRSVHVENTDTIVRVATSHTDLTRGPSTAWGAVYIDTDRDDAGPELVYAAGYSAGSDYRLLKTEGFGRSKWGNEVDGAHTFRLDFAKNRGVMRMSRAAVGADQIRVAVVMSATRGADNEQIFDWLDKPKSFTPWIDRG